VKWFYVHQVQQNPAYSMLANNLFDTYSANVILEADVTFLGLRQLEEMWVKVALI